VLSPLTPARSASEPRARWRRSVALFGFGRPHGPGPGLLRVYGLRMATRPSSGVHPLRHRGGRARASSIGAKVNGAMSEYLQYLVLLPAVLLGTLSVSLFVARRNCKVSQESAPFTHPLTLLRRPRDRQYGPARLRGHVGSRQGKGWRRHCHGKAPVSGSPGLSQTSYFGSWSPIFGSCPLGTAADRSGTKISRFSTKSIKCVVNCDGLHPPLDDSR
jgi:hypothetical protein